MSPIYRKATAALRRAGADIVITHFAPEAAKYVELEPVGASAVLAAQPNQVERNQEIWSRLLGMRLLLVPTPRFVGFSLFRAWRGLPFLRKARTLLGTIRRVIFRGLWRKRPLL